MNEKIAITNKTKDKLPALSFVIIEELKNKILSKDYNLSIAYVSEYTSKKLNNSYRGKNKSTNILSFNVSSNTGELIICPKVIYKEAKSFERNRKQFLLFLIIHGMLHLSGLDHGKKMENLEKKYEGKYLPSTKI